MNTATAEVPMHHRVRTFVGAPRKMLIGGNWLDAVSGKTFLLHSPWESGWLCCARSSEVFWIHSAGTLNARPLSKKERLCKNSFRQRKSWWEGSEAYAAEK